MDQPNQSTEGFATRRGFLHSGLLGLGGGAPEWPGDRGESYYRIGYKYVE